MTLPLLTLLLSLLTPPIALLTPPVAPDSTRPAPVLIDDFESYPVDAVPTKWAFLYKRELRPLTKEYMNERETFYVAEEDGNQFLRAFTYGEAQRITMGNERGPLDWDLEQHPRLRWDWRAMELPEGAREDEKDLNDTGAAVYVTFSFDWLGRPRSIKYTYSSTLPIGTVASYGKLKVIVVSSATNGMEVWTPVERDVVADYRRVFGDDPPDRPVSITLWSDSDNTKSRARVDFDNISLLPPAR